LRCITFDQVVQAGNGSSIAKDAEDAKDAKHAKGDNWDAPAVARASRPFKRLFVPDGFRIKGKKR